MTEISRIDMQDVPVAILVPLLGMAPYDNKLSPAQFSEMKRAQTILGEIAPKAVTVGLGPKDPAPSYAPRPR